MNENNPSIKSYRNVQIMTNYDKIIEGNDVMKNNRQVKTSNITNNDKVTS